MIERAAPPSGTTEADRHALRRIKWLHTLVWAVFAGCIMAMPFASWSGRHRVAAALAALVLVEVLVLAMNGWRCPLTAVEAKYTEKLEQIADKGICQYFKPQPKAYDDTLSQLLVRRITLMYIN